MSTQPASHRSTDGQVIEGWHSAHGHPAYKRGVTGSNPVAPTRSEGMLGGPVVSRRAKRRVVPLPGQSRWLPLRRHQDAPATAGTEVSRHRSGRAARAGGAGGRPSQGGELWQGSCLVFATTIGTMLEQHNVRCGFRQITLSGRPVRRVSSRAPRHTFVSTISAGGVAAEEIARWPTTSRPERPSRSTAVSCAQ